MRGLSVRRRCRRLNRDAGESSECSIELVYVRQKQTNRQVMVLLLVWLFGSISKRIHVVISNGMTH